MARVAKPKIPMRIYQHFAVVTIVLTLAVAILADGENREAASEDIARQTSPAPRPSPTIARSTSAASFGDDEGGGEFGGDVAMGTPMDTGAGRGTSTGFIPDDLPDDATTRTALAAGYPAQALAAMSAAEREQLVKSLRDAGIEDSAVRAARTASLLASSRLRSGSSDEPGLF